MTTEFWDSLSLGRIPSTAILSSLIVGLAFAGIGASFMYAYMSMKIESFQKRAIDNKAARMVVLNRHEYVQQFMWNDEIAEMEKNLKPPSDELIFLPGTLIPIEEKDV